MQAKPPKLRRNAYGSPEKTFGLFRDKADTSFSISMSSCAGLLGLLIHTRRTDARGSGQAMKKAVPIDARTMGTAMGVLLAEGEGFEPPEALTSMVFKTTAIGRSAIPPQE